MNGEPAIGPQPDEAPDGVVITDGEIDAAIGDLDLPGEAAAAGTWLSEWHPERGVVQYRLFNPEADDVIEQLTAAIRKCSTRATGSNCGRRPSQRLDALRVLPLQHDLDPRHVAAPFCDRFADNCVHDYQPINGPTHSPVHRHCP